MLMLILASAASAQSRAVYLDGMSPVSLEWEADRIAVADGEAGVTIYDAATLETVQVVKAKGWPDQVDLSQDGRRVLVAGWKGKPTVFDVDTGDVVAKLKNPTRWYVPRMALLPDGSAVMRTNDEGVEIVPLGDGEATQLHYGYGVSNLGLTQTGAWLQLYGQIQEVGWDGTPHTPIPSSDQVWKVHAAGDELLLQSWSSVVQVVDTTDGGLSWEAPPGLAASSPLAVSPNGSLLAWGIAGSTNAGSIVVWDRDGQEIVATLVGHGSSVVGLDFSPDGTQLASAAYDGTLRIWDVAGPAPLMAAPNSQPALIGFTGDVAVVVGMNGAAHRWDLVTAAYTQTQLPLDAGWELERAMALTPDGTLLASTLAAAVQGYDLETGETVGGPLPAMPGNTDVTVANDGAHAVRSGAWLFSFDAAGEPVGQLPISAGRTALDDGGERVAVAGYDGSIKVFDVTTASSLGVFFEQGHAVLAMQWSQGALIWVDTMGAVRQWTPGEPAEVLVPADPEYYPSVADVQNMRVLMGNYEGQLRLIDAVDGAELGRATIPMDPMGLQLGLHPERPLALVVNTLGQTRLVDLENDTVLGHLTGALPGGGGVSAHGDLVAVVQGDAVTLFDRTTGEGTSLAPDEGVTAATFLDDGTLVTCTREGELQIWTGDGTLLRTAPGVPESSLIRMWTSGGVLYGQDAWGGIHGWRPSANALPAVTIPWAAVGGATSLPDGRLAYSAAWDGVYVQGEGEWDALKVGRRDTRAISGPIAACPDGSLVVAADYAWGSDSTVRIVAPGGNKLDKVQTRVSGIGQLACGAGLAAVGTMTGDVTLVDVASQSTRATLGGDGSAVTGLTFTQDGALAVAYGSGRVRLWDPATATVVLERVTYEDGWQVSVGGQVHTEHTRQDAGWVAPPPPPVIPILELDEDGMPLVPLDALLPSEDASPVLGTIGADP
jgi:WD40 repeat protein